MPTAFGANSQPLHRHGAARTKPAPAKAGACPCEGGGRAMTPFGWQGHWSGPLVLLLHLASTGVVAAPTKSGSLIDGALA
jgi:hypothetical protein